MQIVKVVKTYDGKLHDSVKDARKHLMAAQANILSRLSHKLHMKKFHEVQETIMSNMDIFLEINIINNDIDNIYGDTYGDIYGDEESDD